MYDEVRHDDLAGRSAAAETRDELCGWNSGAQYYRQIFSLRLYTRYEISPCLAINEPAREAPRCVLRDGGENFGKTGLGV